MSQKTKQSMLWTLFTSTFYISMFTFGGGYVIVPLMKERFSKELGWIDQDEILRLISIGQSAPGPVAVNTSIILGYRMCGLLGALVATAGTVIPPLMIMTIATYVYLFIRDNFYVANVMKGMQAGIAAIIFSVVYDMAQRVIKTGDKVHITVMIIALVAAIGFRINVIWLLAFSVVVGIVYSLYQLKRQERE